MGVFSGARRHRLRRSALREAEQTYRTLVEGLPAVVYSAELGRGGKWLYVSPRAETVFGYTAEEWFRDPFLWERSVHPDDLAGVIRTVERCGVTGERFLAEYRFATAEGIERWVRDEASIDRPRTPGGPPVIRGVMYDVTDQKLAEERLRDAVEREQAVSRHLRELDDMKNSILNAVSHELRTPLTSILGMTRLLQEQRHAMTEVDADQFVERIGVNAERLSRLISDLLDLDRLSRGILEPNRQAIDVGKAVARVLDEIPLDGRPLAIDVEAVTAELDPAQFERIVVNLMTNAARYTPRGTPIWLRVTGRPEGIDIVVEDAGPGVPEHLQRSIFDPFRQGDQRVHHSPGIGIGLSLVAKFASLHGGRAWVEDRPGGGASFHVFLASARVRPVLTALRA